MIDFRFLDVVDRLVKYGFPIKETAMQKQESKYVKFTSFSSDGDVSLNSFLAQSEYIDPCELDMPCLAMCYGATCTCTETCNMQCDCGFIGRGPQPHTVTAQEELEEIRNTSPYNDVRTAEGKALYSDEQKINQAYAYFVAWEWYDDE